MAEPTQVKAEPEAEASPAPMDEDLYEDAGDLDMYDKTAGASFENLYLARVPRYMWDAWLKLTERLADDEEVQIGTLRTWNQPVGPPGPDGTTSQETKLRMLLQANCPEHQALPREYELEILDQNVSNHFVFSEEDLPGFKARSKARTDAANAGMPASLLRQKNENNDQPKRYDRRSRYQPYYRKAVPSKQ
jgi:transcription initiation factor TFIIF subunit beta